MFVAASIFSDAKQATVEHRATERLRGWVRGLVHRRYRHRALLTWNRELPRPASCTRVPERVWRRHSALLSERFPTRGQVSR